MSRNLEQTIRKYLAEYISGQIGVSDLHELIAPVLWDIEDAGDPDVENLTYSVELFISEYAAGHRTETSLRRELGKFVTYNSKTTSSSSDWETIERGLQPSGIEYETEFSSSASC